ncbi:hypothetical protein JX265_004245 [Neoarthrinium moseri]|uniref:Uncharacterized protein n=1 Tax=Neoarthrinium moseri TaxID=1658444 RepID=A0A9Q0ASQ3_9PEZI|nr:hypothetical protein JX265_004245 [Neoarthrinium moseri]
MLEDLAPELVFHVLHAVDGPQDLLSLLKASPRCYKVFVRSRQSILSSVIKNALLPEALHHALALFHIPPPGSDSNCPALADLMAFLDIYFEEGAFTFPNDLSMITSLCRLLLRVNRYVDDYFEKAKEALNLPSDAAAKSLPLSPIERTRMQRAFLRFELYCQICPVDRWCYGLSLSKADVQFEHFLSRMAPWEVEELSSIHQVLTSIVRKHISDMEEQLIDMILSSPGIKIPHGFDQNADHKRETRETRITEGGVILCASPISYAEPSSAEGPDLKQSDSVTHMSVLQFETVELIRLEMFSDIGTQTSLESISYVTSLGLDFFEQFRSADVQERNNLIRRKTPLFRHFLPEALDYAPMTSTKTDLRQLITDDASHP